MALGGVACVAVGGTAFAWLTRIRGRQAASRLPLPLAP